MWDIDKDPVLYEFVAFTTIHIDDPHFARTSSFREPKKSPCISIAQIGPSEKPAIIAFRKARDMAIISLVREVSPEWMLMLHLIALDRIGRANAARAGPNHVIVPGPREQLR